MAASRDAEDIELSSASSDSDNRQNGLYLTNSPPLYSRRTPVDDGVTLAWDNLSVYANENRSRVKNKNIKRIISSVSGAVKPGSLVAIMGASGAGKSTLLSALAHKSCGEINVEGDILINGRQIGPYMRHLSGFMYQEDLFVPYLKVKEHLNILAHLKLDRRTNSVNRHKKIQDLLRKLGIWNCANSVIGGIDQNKGISGGEKKRLAFASELLTDPPLLFCDEPTTGLDSYSAQILVNIMNSLAIEGKTVLCTIHQPTSDIFAMFSQLILLAEGRIAYMGPTNEAMLFFKKLGYVCPTSYNPADFYIRTLACSSDDEANCRRTIKRICDQFAVSDYAREIEVLMQYEFHIGRLNVVPFFEQEKKFKGIFWPAKLYWLTYRWFLETVRDPSIETAKLIQRLVLALMIGSCYFGVNPTTQAGIQAVQGLIFIFVTENTFSPMYATLAEFPRNKPLFIREYSAGLYDPSTYYLSKILSMIPGFILGPALFVVIAYWIAGLKSTTYAFLMTTLIIILTLNVSSACGIMFSNAFVSLPMSLSYLVPFDYILMITSGIFIKLNTLPTLLSWTKYLSWLMYSTESLSIIQWEGIHNISCDVNHAGLPCITEGNTVLDRYNFSVDHLSRNIFSLVVLLGVFYFIGYLCLLWRTKRET